DDGRREPAALGHLGLLGRGDDPALQPVVAELVGVLAHGGRVGELGRLGRHLPARRRAGQQRDLRDLRCRGVRLQTAVGVPAAAQTHFASPSNRFYPALYAAGIIEEPLSPSDGMTDADRDMLRARGIGITNIVRRATARADELSRTELRAGTVELEATVRRT